MISISVILCIWYWKVEFCTKSSCTNSFSYVHVSILHNQRSCSNALTALLLLYPSVVLVLANRTGCRQAQQNWMLCQSAYLLPFLLRTPFQQDLDFSASASVGCRKASVCSGWRGMGRQAQSQVRCKTWLFFQRRDYHFFFPFQDTCQGSISGKWKDRAVFLGLWSGMITDRKDKCTFSGARATVKVTEKVEAFSH